MESIGAGLGAVAFWGFLAAVVVGGIWYSAREREAQHETLRRIIESGQPIDEELMSKLLSTESNKRPDRNLRIGGLVVLFTAPGLALLGWFVSLLSEQWLFPMLGVAALVACIGIGLLAASEYAARSYRSDDASAIKRNMAL